MSNINKITLFKDLSYLRKNCLIDDDPQVIVDRIDNEPIEFINTINNLICTEKIRLQTGMRTIVKSKNLTYSEFSGMQKIVKYSTIRNWLSCNLKPEQKPMINKLSLTTIFKLLEYAKSI